MTGARIVQINVSRGGVPKRPVSMATVGEPGLSGDEHLNQVHHGGPERAVSLFAIERIEALAAEGHPIFAGATGENVTIGGLDWQRVIPGARLRLGADVLLEVTRFAAPCKTIRAAFKDGYFNRLSGKVYPGWSRAYARVITCGLIRAGDAVQIVE